MRTLLLTLVLISISTISYCQKYGKLITKTVSKFDYNSDNRDLVIKGIEEDQITKKYNTKYRIWTDSKLIEVYELGDSATFGQIVSFAFRIKRRDESITKICYTIDKLSSLEATDILKSVSVLDSIPTSDSIDGYKFFLDGNFYGIDILTNRNYIRKDYDNLYGQESPEFEPIKDFYSGLKRDYLNSKHEVFLTKLPYGAYKYLSETIIIEKR